jgi:hypothetical protein
MILPFAIASSNARTWGLGYMTIKKADNNVAKVHDNTNVQSKHVVKTQLRECPAMSGNTPGSLISMPFA